MTDHKKRFEAGVAAFKKGDYKDAVDHFSAVIDAQTPGHMALESRAACYQEMGRYKEALLDAKRIIQLFPDKHNGYSRSSRILTIMGHYDRAVSLARTALQKANTRDPKSSAKVQQVLDAAIEAQQANLEKLRLSECHVNKLPFELLACVFDELVLPGDMHPMRLAHVCRMWRGVLMSMSHIWSKLVLDGKGKRFKSKVDFWMERSKGRIQDLHIRHLPSFLVWLEAYGNNSLPFVDHVTVNFGSDVVNLKPIFRFDANPLSLTWTGSSHDRGVPRRLLFTPLQSHPYRLRELELDNIKLLWQIEAPQLEDLTKLVIMNTRIDVEELIPILEKSRRIQTLHVSPDLRGSSTNLPKERILLPNLASLGLSRSCLLLTYIEVPELRNLNLQFISLKHAFELLSPVQPPLTTLAAQECADAYQAQLPLVDSLTSLSLSSMSMPYDQIVGRLAAGECPLLTELSLSRVDISTGALVRLIKARNPPQEPTNAQDKSVTEDTKEAAKETENKTGNEVKFARLGVLNLDRCPNIDSEMLPWMRSRVKKVICKFEVKKKSRGATAQGYMV
ncbi:SubName: Full=Uncharacterized protein {ECO:0000313/EMBL:CCA67651.1} [Serendipita indica DSM 11827]|nr:SubName: Full=Uncharacterized protein {ECO:0000313/EMBL:CCA67651.1} [Serendipita indica DSM 11827]